MGICGGGSARSANDLVYITLALVRPALAACRLSLQGTFARCLIKAQATAMKEKGLSKRDRPLFHQDPGIFSLASNSSAPGIDMPRRFAHVFVV